MCAKYIINEIYLKEGLPHLMIVRNRASAVILRSIASVGYVSLWIPARMALRSWTEEAILFDYTPAKKVEKSFRDIT